MPRGVKKENLPSKICEVCNRPFTWRKVWERCWDEVKTCSDRCKAERKRKSRAEATQVPKETEAGVVNEMVTLAQGVAGRVLTVAWRTHLLLFDASPRKLVMSNNVPCP